MMGNSEFIKKCKELVVDYFNSQADSTDKNGKITEERIEKIIDDDLQYENPSLAEKLREHKDIWLRNYKIMDLLHVDDITIKRLK